MAHLDLNKEEFNLLLSNGNYGSVIDRLIEIPDSMIKKLGSKEKSSFFLLKGILWELLGHYINAKTSYLLSLDINSNNQLTNQYLAQIYFKIGNIPKSRLFFRKLFSLNLKSTDFFNLNRSLIGFRDRTQDISHLEEYSPINSNLADQKYKALGFTYFSMLFLEGAINNLNKVKDLGKEGKIILLVAKYLLKERPMIIDELSKLRLDLNDLFSQEINKFLRSLTLLHHNTYPKGFSYSPKIPKYLINLTKDIQGWLDLCEGNLLYQSVKNLATNNKTSLNIAEIGSFRGRSTIFLTQAMKEKEIGKIFSIDPHKGVPYYHPEPTLSCFIQNLKSCGLENYVKICKGTSLEWSSKIKSEIDMVFIDGNHDYEMVKKDYKMWSENLKEDGFIAFHDILQDGPFRLINELVKSKSLSLLKIVGNLAILKIKKNNTLDIYSAIHLIVLNIYQKFYLNFIEKDKKSMINQALMLINYLT